MEEEKVEVGQQEPEQREEINEAKEVKGNVEATEAKKVKTEEES